MLIRPSTPQLVAIGSLTRRPELQPRVQMNEALVEEYREAMIEGAEFPSIDAIELPDGERILGDGWHRCAAAERAGHTDILTKVWRGSYEEAVEFISKRNARHGERRTMADLGKSIKMLRSLAKWQNASNVEIAKHFGLSESTIRRAQSQTAANQPILVSHAEDAANPIENIKPIPLRERRIVTRGGREYPMTLPSKPKPKPEPPLSNAEASKARSAKAAERDLERLVTVIKGRGQTWHALKKRLRAEDFLDWYADAPEGERARVRAWFEEHEG